MAKSNNSGKFIDFEELLEAVFETEKKEYDNMISLKFKYENTSTARMLLEIIKASLGIIKELMMDEKDFKEKYGSAIITSYFSRKAEEARDRVMEIRDELKVRAKDNNKNGGNDDATAQN